MEINVLIRNVFVKVRAVVGQGDVTVAFGNMSQDSIAVSLDDHGAHPQCIVALMREIAHEHATVLLQDVFVDGIRMQQGGKQGRVETPKLWNISMDTTLAPVQEQFNISKICFECPPNSHFGLGRQYLGDHTHRGAGSNCNDIHNRGNL